MVTATTTPSKKEPIRACVRCRARKQRCSGYPCSYCQDLNVVCTIAKDRRSTRLSNSEAGALRARIQALEGQLDSLANYNTNLLRVLKENGLEASAPEGECLPDTTELADVSASAKYPKPGEFSKIDNDDPRIIWSAYGPTSIFNEGSGNEGVESGEGEGSGREDLVTSYSVSTLHLLNKNPQILKHVRLFFQHMYPDVHMFIPRETFLVDFHHPKGEDQPSYCTKELVYAICAIGSMHDSSFPQSDSYYNIAKGRLFMNLNCASMPSLQAFILLGLYDVYCGRNDSGWILTGIGLRMGFNLGFHLSPPATVSDLSVKFKSRIYWGCFVVDHLLALIFGRPSTLHVADSTIQESDKVPDLDWIREFQGVDGVIEIANPLKAIVRLFVTVEDAMNELFVANTDLGGPMHLHTKLSKVRRFNEKIESWRMNLSTDLQWVQGGVMGENSEYMEGGAETLAFKSKSPPKMNHVLCYYISLLCINRPFITKSADEYSGSNQAGHERTPELYLSKSIDDLESHIVGVVVKCLRDLSIALSQASGWGSILVIYAAVIGVSTVMMLGNSREYSGEKSGKRSRWLMSPSESQLHYYEENPLQFQREKELRYWFFTLMGVLEAQQESWVLARKVFAMVNKRLKTGFGVGYTRAVKAWREELKTRTLDIPPEVDFSPLDDLWDGDFGDAIVPIEFETLFKMC